MCVLFPWSIANINSLFMYVLLVVYACTTNQGRSSYLLQKRLFLKYISDARRGIRNLSLPFHSMKATVVIFFDAVLSPHYLPISTPARPLPAQEIRIHPQSQSSPSGLSLPSSRPKFRHDISPFILFDQIQCVMHAKSTISKRI